MTDRSWKSLFFNGISGFRIWLIIFCISCPPGGFIRGFQDLSMRFLWCFSSFFTAAKLLYQGVSHRDFYDVSHHFSLQPNLCITGSLPAIFMMFLIISPWNQISVSQDLFLAFIRCSSGFLLSVNDIRQETAHAWNESFPPHPFWQKSPSALPSLILPSPRSCAKCS